MVPCEILCRLYTMVRHINYAVNQREMGEFELIISYEIELLARV